MNWQKLIIDLLGIGFEIFLATLIFRTFWFQKPVKRHIFLIGFCSIAALNLAATQFFQNQYVLTATLFFSFFIISFYYEIQITFQILLSVIVLGVILFSEMVTGLVLTRLLNISIEQIQGMWIAYGIGLIGSKLFAMVLIYIFRFFVPPRSYPVSNKWFNLAMTLLPLQSLLLGFVVQDLAAYVGDTRALLLSEIALIASLFLIIITVFILNNQLRSMAYKNAYESAHSRLEAQIEHNQELYEMHKQIRGVRHEMRKTLLGIAGLIKKGNYDEALEKTGQTQLLIDATESEIDIGSPSIDAILNAAIKEANKKGISINHKIMIGNDISRGAFDVALLLANALENAIEAIEKSTGIDRTIFLSMNNRSDYLAIQVINHTSENVKPNLRTTKKDKENHGYGIWNMRKIVEQYNGDFKTEFDSKARTFTLKVLLKI